MALTNAQKKDIAIKYLKANKMNVDGTTAEIIQRYLDEGEIFEESEPETKKTKVVNLRGGVQGKDITFFRPGDFRYALLEVQEVIIKSKKEQPMNGVKLLLRTEAGIDKTVQSIDSDFCASAVKLGHDLVENVTITFVKDDSGYVNPISIK